MTGPSMQGTSNPNADKAGVDKDFLYGRFEAGEAREMKRREDRDRLYMKAAHKALDIAEDEQEPMDIQANRINNGMGIKELAILAAMLLGTGIGGAAFMHFLPAKEQPQEVPPQESQGEDRDTLFNLEFTEPKEVKDPDRGNRGDERSTVAAAWPSSPRRRALRS